MPGTAVLAPRRVRRPDYERTRRRILEAARRLMVERGPESLTVSAVAHAAEINRTTAYQHFRTRDELVEAVTKELIEEVGARLAEPLPIAERIDVLALYFVDHPEIARLVLHLLLTESPIPREAWSLFAQEMRHLTATAGSPPDVDPEMLGHLLMGVAILWPLHARSAYEDEARARIATQRLTRELKRLLLYGLFRPEAWPELVASVERGRGPAQGRPRRKA
jgi:AcrR family transcriptional regulator